MADPQFEIVVLKDKKILPAQLASLLDQGWGGMVKYVVDVTRSVVAFGGELHADAEELLLRDGSRQADLWGANFYPRRAPDLRIQYTALINIRPRAGNLGMEVQDPSIRRMIREVSERLILGSHEQLP